MVFGLNSAATTARATECVTGPTSPETAIDAAFVSKGATKLKVVGKQTDTWGKEFESIVSVDGTELFKANSKMSGMTQLTITYSAGDKEICTVAGSGGLMKAGATISKGGTEVGAINISKGLTSASATYTKGGEVIFKAEKYSEMQFFMTVLDAGGSIVGKCMQPSLMATKELDVEVGDKVDLVALMILTGTVGASSGSSAGGLAGAGVTT